jgi:hypothetical protein
MTDTRERERERESNNGASRARRALTYILIPVLLFTAYLFGAYSYPRNIFPIDLLRTLKNKSNLSAALGNGQYDNFGRLTSINGKSETACPTQSSDTGVLLAIGQSNSANHADKKVATRFPSQVFNYYDGKCYVASSPLLGATGEEGEFITPLADKLIENGTYKTIVIIASGIGGTPISRWQADGDLNQMLLDSLASIKKYKITDVIWHQGESDFGNSTSAKVYEKSFHSLKDSLRSSAISAPFFIAVATKCGNKATWKEDNPTALGQKKLEDNREIFVAANTDELLENVDRRSDLCHFSETGQIKTANAYADAIQKYRKSH